jgi:hypothetical protein
LTDGPTVILSQLAGIAIVILCAALMACGSGFSAEEQLPGAMFFG